MRAFNRTWQLVALALAVPIMGVSILSKFVSLVTKEAAVYLLEQFKDKDWSWPKE